MSSVSGLTPDGTVSPLEEGLSGARVLRPDALPDANLYAQAHEDDPSAPHEGLLLICGWVDRVPPGIEPGTFRTEGECSTHWATRTPTCEIPKSRFFIDFIFYYLYVFYLIVL